MAGRFEKVRRRGAVKKSGQATAVALDLASEEKQGAHPPQN